MIRSLFGGITTKCRTVDKLDIFGDGSCKALYRFDGNANDESGNYHGTETAITYGGGVYERGAVFNGSSSYITNSATKTSLLNGYSISMWVLHSDINTNRTLIGEINVNQSLIEITRLSSNLISYRMYTDGSSSQIMALLSLPYSPTINTYYHYVFQWDGTTNTNGIKIYINGVINAQGTASLTASNIGNITGMFIGRRYDGLYHSGSIDQVRIFNRAITAQEVATLYAECEPTSIVDNINPFEDGSLKALYQFEDNANDLTGVYDGTPTNVTYGTGKFGKCAVFNGSSSKIDTATGITPVNFSFSAWVNLSSVTLASDIFGTMTSIAYAVGYVIAVSNNLLYILSSSNGTSFTANYNTPFTQLNTWTHISIVVNSDNSIKMYINGNQVTVTPTTTGVITKGATSDRIGTGGASTIHGSIDQLRIFNKALTPMEVASLYNETTPLEEPLYSLVDPFKDGSGKALYRLEGNALDESVNYNGTPTALTYGLGRFGRCGVFNGSSTRINASFANFASTGVTVSVWVNIVAHKNYNYIMNFYENNSFMFASDSTGAITFGGAGTIVSSAYTVGQWLHVVGTITAGGFATLYINGSSVGTTTSALWFSDTNRNDTFGCGNPSLGTYSSYLNGSLDQVRIFNKALTQSEVTALYNEI